jgi:DsbC/DsbD-like thiol-disulfide interchange protein
MTPFQDLFVGCAAIIFGCLLIAGAIVESAMLMSLIKTQRLVELVGKATARWIIAGIGIASMALGVLIASGWRVHW